MNNTPLLEMEGISKRFPGVVALDQVDLTVGEGEVVALIGENGAGKSTLMNILGGAIARDAGTIKINGKPVEINSPREAAAYRIEFIHQELSVLDNLDVAANIFLRREPTIGGVLKLIDRRRIYSEADVFVRKLGLDISSRTLLSRLSIAQQQLVEIARALRAGARIIIMDEPTSSLTLTETRRLLEIVRDLSRSRATARILTLKRAQDLLGRIHDLEVLIARTRAIQGSPNAPTLPVSADMDLLVRRLETECRRLHGRYIAMRAPMLTICDHVSGGPTSRRGEPAA
jgi:ABC-type sugar transport system ATPase subunit